MSGPLRLLLLVGFAALGLFFLQRMPRNVTLVYALDDATSVRSVEVEVRRQGETLRHAEYRFPAGAPAQVRHEVRLPDGSYDVLLWISREGAKPFRSVRPVVVSESGPIVLSIREKGARTD